MPENRIADLFQIQNRYLRSVHLERDFADTSALQGYIVTDYAKTNLERMAAGLAASSGQRAWRITGYYGSNGICVLGGRFDQFELAKSEVK